VERQAPRAALMLVARPFGRTPARGGEICVVTDRDLVLRRRFEAKLGSLLDRRWKSSDNDVRLTPIGSARTPARWSLIAREQRVGVVLEMLRQRTGVTVPIAPSLSSLRVTASVHSATADALARAFEQFLRPKQPTITERPRMLKPTNTAARRDAEARLLRLREMSLNLKVSLLPRVPRQRRAEIIMGRRHALRVAGLPPALQTEAREYVRSLYSVRSRSLPGRLDWKRFSDFRIGIDLLPRLKVFAYLDTGRAVVF